MFFDQITLIISIILHFSIYENLIKTYHFVYKLSFQVFDVITVVLLFSYYLNLFQVNLYYSLLNIHKSLIKIIKNLINC